MCFEKGVWLLVSCFRSWLIAAAAGAAATSSSSQNWISSRISEGTFGPRGACYCEWFCAIVGTKFGGVLLFRMWFEKGVWLLVSCFRGWLIAAAAEATSSSTSSSSRSSSPQQQQSKLGIALEAGWLQQQQPPAAAAVCLAAIIRIMDPTSDACSTPRLSWTKIGRWCFQRNLKSVLSLRSSMKQLMKMHWPISSKQCFSVLFVANPCQVKPSNWFTTSSSSQLCIHPGCTWSHGMPR